MVQTRFCIISDTHNAVPKPAGSTSYAFREPLPKCDVLLHAGDITMEGELEEYELALSFLRKADAELKIVIAGNHDTTLDKDYVGRWGPGETPLERHELNIQAVNMWTSEEVKKAGIVYLEEGMRTFELRNGAKFTIYTSPYQPESCNWAFAYPRERDRFNPSLETATWNVPNPVPNEGVDIMLTHGPPLNILDTTMDRLNVGCKHLLRAVERVKPRLHCFGHIHESYGCKIINWHTKAKTDMKVDIEKESEDGGAFIDVSTTTRRSPVRKGEETIFVNAAIMNLIYRPVNAPWVVDLDLDAADAMMNEA